MHFPAEQVVPAPHFTPQPPQLLVSDFSSTQAPAQEVSPVPQIAAHLPAEQLSVEVHVVPHTPQFLGSLVRSTHVPPYAVVPVGQVHAPATHAPEHDVRPVPEVATHLPVEQT